MARFLRSVWYWPSGLIAGKPGSHRFLATRYPGRTIFMLNAQVRAKGTLMAMTMPTTNIGM
ncbi:hypothetical protein D9M68_981810 [compost metagenome]